ncbi:MAG: hypothetical protein IV107_10930 [Paucibacter sp.]|nr:hypothetical protein [Roseateles sp.]
MSARLATPQALFLDADGVSSADDAKPLLFADWCRAHPGEAAQITVSAQLLHELVCEPGLPLDDEAALQAYARQLFGHYFGAAAKSWPLATWRVAGKDKSEQCGASALHGAAGAALQAAAYQFDVSLRSVQPAWAPLLQRLAQQQPAWGGAPTAALAWVEGQVLTWLLLQDGRPQVLRQLRLSAATQAALAETLRELCAPGEAGHQAKVLVAGYGLDAATLLESNSWPGLQVLNRLDARRPEPAWFDVAAPLRTLPEADFLGVRHHASALAWPLLGLGLLALLATAWSGFDGRQQLQQATQRKAELQAELRQASGAPKLAAAPIRAGLPKSAELEQQRSAAEVQALLRQPWEALLSHVEQAGAGPQPAGSLSWLALDFSAARQELRLEGLVQDKSVALAVVDRLAAAPAWRQVVLSRFSNAEQGLAGQRFELSAKLRPSLLTLELAELPPKDGK